MKPRAGVASGAVMVLLGLFVVLRTVRRPTNGNNLVDVITGTTNNAAVDAADAAEAQRLLDLPRLTDTPRSTPTPMPADPLADLPRLTPRPQGKPAASGHGTATRRRLFAHPRPNNVNNGGRLQLRRGGG